jgi:hypothetical protein
MDAMKPSTDPLAPELQRLLDVGRALEAPDSAKRRVSERLTQSILGIAAAPAPLGSPTNAEPRPWVRWIAKRPALSLGMTFALGALVGLGADRLRPPRVRERVVYVERAAKTVPVDVVEPVVAAPPTPIHAPERVRPRAAPPVHRSSLEAERALLDVARHALAAGEPQAALAPLSQHGARFPDGVLVEEREALAVNALVALTRYDEARERADSFLRHYPNSLLRASVQSALAAIP